MIRVSRSDLEALDKPALIELVLRLAEQVAALQERLAELEKTKARSAAPFARPEGKRSAAPKTSGRKKGHEGNYRKPPSETEIGKRIEVGLPRCPACGADLPEAGDEKVVQIIIEAPEPRPQVIELVTHRNRCRCCGEEAASRHPLQVSTATGAAGTHLGPRALAAAAQLHAGLGLPMRKTCAVLRELLGVSLTPGGLSQALARIARRLDPCYGDLLARLKASAVMHTDETGWWVAGKSASLWVMTGQAGTAYHIAASRSRAEAQALIGGYEGVLVSDCLNIYDDLTPVQQKCYAHHLRAIKSALESKGQAGSAYLGDLRGMLRAAMALKDIMADWPQGEVARMRKSLEENAGRLLHTAREGPGEAAEERVRKRLLKQADHLFTFLDHPEAQATNNMAERQLRPAVIARKLSWGNKTANGAKTWQTLASLAATCRQTGENFATYIAPKIVLNPAA